MRRELDTTRAIQSIGTNIVIFEFFDDEEMANESQVCTAPVGQTCEESKRPRAKTFPIERPGPA